MAQSGKLRPMTLFVMLTGLMIDLPEGSRLQYVTLKFFETVHTFMAADSFPSLKRNFGKLATSTIFATISAACNLLGKRWKWCKETSTTSRAGS